MVGHTCTSTGINATCKKGSLSYKPHEPPPEAINKSRILRGLTILEIKRKSQTCELCFRTAANGTKMPVLMTESGWAYGVISTWWWKYRRQPHLSTNTHTHSWARDNANAGHGGTGEGVVSASAQYGITSTRASAPEESVFHTDISSATKEGAKISMWGLKSGMVVPLKTTVICVRTQVAYQSWLLCLVFLLLGRQEPLWVPWRTVLHLLVRGHNSNALPSPHFLPLLWNVFLHLSCKLKWFDGDWSVDLTCVVTSVWTGLGQQQLTNHQRVFNFPTWFQAFQGTKYRLMSSLSKMWTKMFVYFFILESCQGVYHPQCG